MLKRPLLLLALLASPAAADDAARPDIVPLTAAQISTLLAGNTVEGTWSGTPYRQTFGENGQTLYIAEGSPPDMGRWRTNADTNEYESIWQSGGWTGYTVLFTNEGYAWKRSEGYELFSVVPSE